jgi:hypothetical protein
MGAGTRAASVGQELFLYAVSAALSCLVLFVGLRHLDPNRAQIKKAQEQKKEIAKRLGRPLIQTNTYEVYSHVSLRREMTPTFATTGVNYGVALSCIEFV